MYEQLELPLNHDPSLNHWAKCLADDDIATGYHTDWNHAYESAWDSLDAEFNYSYIQGDSHERNRIFDLVHDE